MKQGNLKKKVGSLLLAAAMVVTSFPAISSEVYAAGNTLPDVSQFATVDDLRSFNTNDKDGTKNPAKVYFGKGDQQWWIAGSQSAEGLTLFAASPFKDKQKFDDSTSDNKQYEGESVNQNHYGASRIKNQLGWSEKEEQQYDFSAAELRLMNPTTIYTEDTRNNKVYSTTNKLYLAYGAKDDKYITVGTNGNTVESLNNGLHVDWAYWGEEGKKVWLRAPYRERSDNALAASQQGTEIDSAVREYPISTECLLVPAFELNLSSVAFASAVSAVSSEGKLETKDAYTLRFQSKDIGTATISKSKESVAVTGVTNDKTYLVAQNTSGAWAKKLSNNDLVFANEMGEGFTSFENCKVWMETTNENDRITYASEAVEGKGYHINIVGGDTLEIQNGIQANVESIKEITVEAAEGYGFSADYISKLQGQLKGLTVNETDTGFTISGTLNSDVEIELPAATILQKAETPKVTTQRTATSITATVTNHEQKFGDIEYKWDDGDWEEGKSRLSNLQPDSPHNLAVRFSGSDSYQRSEEWSGSITTLKDGNSAIDVPTDLSATYTEGLKLSDIDLSTTGWKWVDGETLLSAGTESYPATFDTTNLESTTDFSEVEGYDKDSHKVTRNIEVQVAKAKSKVTITTQSLDKVYDGSAVNKPEYTISGSDGEVTITWQKNTGTEENPKWEDLKSAPSDAGTYQVVVELAGDSNYASEKEELEFVISQAENKWTEELTITGWTYKEEANTPSAKAQFGDVVYTYSSEENGTYTNSVPVNAGTWYVKASVTETTNYKGLASDPVEFKIAKANTTLTFEKENIDKIYDKNEISEPKVRKTGSSNDITFAWFVENGNDWKQLDNAPSDVGEYKVVASVTEDTNYNGASIEKEFSISMADNEWTKELSIKDWTYGETASVPSAEAKYGDVIYTYSNSKDGAYTSDVPVNVGTWYVKASVTETTNYKGLTSEPVEFKITKADTKMSVSLKDDKRDYTYGDIIELSVSVAPGKTKTAAQNKAAVFVGENQITEALSITEGEPVNISINTTDENVKEYLKPSESEITLMVQYGGNDNLNEKAGSVSITLAKKDSSIKFKDGLDLNKTYDGKPVELNVEEDVMKEGSSKDITISWQTVEGTVLDKAPVHAGTYKVVVSVDEDDYYKAASVEKGFTISKADSVIAIANADELSKVYDGKEIVQPEVTKEGNTNNVTIKYFQKVEEEWKPLESMPSQVGEYKVVASVEADENYKEDSVTKEFSITKSETNMSVSLKDDKSDYTYGDIIELSVSIAPGKTRTAAQNKAAVFVGENQITEEFSITEGKSVNISIDTTNKNVKKYLKPSESEITLTVQYGGSDNLNEKAGSVSIKLAKKDTSIKFKDGLDLNKTYDGQPVELNVEKDVTKEGSSKNVTISWKTAEGTVLDKAPVHAGTYKAVASVETDDYYKAASVEKDFTISKADSEIAIINGDELSKVYDGKEIVQPKVTKEGSTKAVTIKYFQKVEEEWKPLKVKPSQVGEYKVVASVEADENYKEDSVTKEFSITKSETNMSVSLKDGKRDYTYGDMIELSVSVAPGKTRTVAQNEAAVFVGGNQITEEFSITEGKSVNISIDTTNENVKKYLKPSESEIALTVQYGGSDNLNEKAGSVSITLAKKDTSIKFRDDLDLNKTYDGKPVELNRTEDIIKDGSSKEITVEWKTAEGKNLTEAPVYAGTYKAVVSVETDAYYKAASVEKEFTISKANSEIAIINGDELSKVYDGKEIVQPEVTKEGNTNNVTIKYFQKVEEEWKPLESMPSQVGEYKVVASVEADENYKEDSVTKEFFITKSETNISVSLKDGKSNYTYGDIIELSVSIAPGKTRTAAQNKAAVFVEENQITEEFSITEGKPVNISIDTTDEKVKEYLKPSESQIALTVQYGGNDNLNEKAGSVSITLAKKDSSIKFRDDLDLNKTYDGQPVELNAQEDVTKEGSSKDITISWKTAEGTVLDKAPVHAGTYKAVASVETDDYYKAASVEIGFTISKATPIPDKITGLVLGQGMTLKQLELPNGFAWADNTQIAEELGTHEFKAIFTPEDTTNYEQVEVMVAVEVVPKLTPVNHVPTITANDKELSVGDEFDPLKDVTASDKEDGDLTSKIEVVDNKVDTSKAGTYTVTYKVTDSQGASAIRIINVVVYPKMETVNHIPMITAGDKELTVGDGFDPLKDVTASDKEDGDLTSKIEVVDNKVDTSKAGTYTVTYKVTDSQGASVTKVINVAVYPKMEALNHIPTITANDKELSVGDEFDPLRDVTASDKEDGDLTSKIQVIDNKVDTSKVGTYTVTYKVTDSQGASAIRIINVAVYPKMETINHIPTITAGDKELTVGDGFDPLKDVTASDKEDGDLTSRIQVIDNKVDTSKAGTYTVTYQVTDSQGASAIRIINVAVYPKMEALNHIPTITAGDKELTVGDEFDPLRDVTASDKEDGDLTLKIEVIENKVDTAKEGTYTVTYKVTDSQGASVTKIINVAVYPKMEALNHIPTITAGDKELMVGEEFDPLKDVTASDKEDGDLTSKIEVVENKVDTAKEGTYTVTYKVTDSQGASVTRIINVVVYPKMEVNSVPTITAGDKELTVGDKFDPLKDVTASDKEDGDLTSKIEVVENKVDTSKEGTYTVTYKVTDSQGASVTKTIHVAVCPKVEVNSVPTITAGDKELTVGDKFDPLKGVTASDKEDGDLTSKVEVVENKVDTSKAGTYTVTYKVTDSQGADVTKTIKVVVKEKKKPAVSEKPEGNKPDAGNTKNQSAVKTGDETSLGLWTTIFAASGLGIVVMALLKRRKHNK